MATGVAPNSSNTNHPTRMVTEKLFAAPGIDSGVEEYGVFASGAGRAPHTATTKASPTDWGNEAPTQSYETENFVSGYPETKAPSANSLQVRRRGKAPFGGFFAGARASLAYQHPGGITDHNAGADHLIAGGPGAASTFCRVNVLPRKKGQGMKLPVLPTQVVRGGLAGIPSGGGGHEPLAAPLQPKISGWKGIFSFRNPGMAVNK